MSKASAEITEIFSSIQGEGIFAGVKQIFVRFKACNLACNFCDEPRDSAGKIYTPESLMDEIKLLTKKKGLHHSVSLTGGEPLCYADFLSSFLPLLSKAGKKSYLETNGTLPGELARVIGFIDIIAMDFKLPSSTGERAFWNEHLEFLKIASKKKVFVKAIVTPETTAEDIRQAVFVIKKLNRRVPFILQPAAPVKRSDREVDNKTLLEFMEIGIDNDLEQIRVLPQVHKMMRIK